MKGLRALHTGSALYALCLAAVAIVACGTDLLWIRRKERSAHARNGWLQTLQAE
jgi:hypothetical protein